MKHLQYELLRENPKALQFLHEAKQFDFEKDFLILKIENHFTHNAIKKEIEKYISGDYEAAILLKRATDYSTHDELYYVDMNLYRFYPLREDRGLPYWKYNIDWFFSIGDFEDVRKKKTDHIFVIAQSTKHLVPKEESKTDFSQRFILEGVKRAGDGRGNTYISELHLIRTNGSNSEFTFYPNKTFYPALGRENVLENIIDKSGYILTLRRNDLKRRAAALKADREKNRFLESDFSKENAVLHEKIETVKKTMAEKTLQTRTYDDAKKLDEAINIFRWLMMYTETHDEKIKNKTFSSVQAAKNSFSELESKISKINDVWGVK